MVNIDTKPLSSLKDKPTSIVRIIVGTFVGICLIVGGTVVAFMNNFLLSWAVICANVIIILIIYAYISSEYSHRKTIQRFAKANNLVAISDDKYISLVPPVLQDTGVNQVFKNGYHMDISGVNVSIFDFYENQSSNKHLSMYSVAVLPTMIPYPHIFLDAKQNNLNHTYNSAQKLSLEGDFDKYFNLYSPDNAQIDTLSFLTPDVMQKFIDTANLFDVEVKDNHIYLIITGTSVYYKSNMDRLLICLNALISKIAMSDDTQTMSASTDKPTTSQLILQKNKTNMLLAVGITVSLIFVVLLMVLKFKLYAA